MKNITSRKGIKPANNSNLTRMINRFGDRSSKILCGVDHCMEELFDGAQVGLAALRFAAFQKRIRPGPGMYQMVSKDIETPP